MVDPEELAGGTAVVIDVLRATTTIAYALDAGRQADHSLPRNRRRPGPGRAVPARRGPAGRRARRVADRRLRSGQLARRVHSRAGRRARRSSSPRPTAPGRSTTPERPTKCCLAAFVNAGAVVRRLFDREQIHILCAGTDGQDQRGRRAAGRHVGRAAPARGRHGLPAERPGDDRPRNLAPSFALPQALGAEPLDPDRLAGELRKSLGGQNLMSLGLDDDILAAVLDRAGSTSCRRLDTKTMRIRAEGLNDE